MTPTLVQKILSYLYPVKIRSGSSEINPFLELYLHSEQWQLTTKDAIYSDGDRYRPLKLAFSKLKNELASVKDVLILGTGLGSAVTLLDKMGVRPKIDLVEIDSTILNWAKEFLPSDQSRLKFICADAEKFIDENKKQYDLLVIDIFISKVVPDFVTEIEFLSRCKQRLSLNGILVMNYLDIDPDSHQLLEKKINELFSALTTYRLGVNSIYIARDSGR